MPTRLCAIPTCPEPATYRGKCAEHNRSNERTTDRAGKQVYSTKRWAMTRRKVLFLNPLCECGEIATDVHHIRDLADGGVPYDQANLEAMCHSCHSKHTRQVQRST